MIQHLVVGSLLPPSKYNHEIMFEQKAKWDLCVFHARDLRLAIM